MKALQIVVANLLLLGLPIFMVSCDSLATQESSDPAGSGNANYSSQSPSSQSLTDGLLAHWTLDDANGSVVTDASINGFDGTNYGGLWTSGIISGALEFDGFDDKVIVPSEGISPPPEIGALTQGTLCMWFKYEEFLSDTLQVAPIFYFGRDQGPYSGLIVEIGHDNNPTAPNRRLYFTIVDLAGGAPIQCFDSNFDLDPDTWYHFCAVVSETGNTGYLDGLELTDRRYNLGSDETFTEFFASISVQDMLALGYGKYSKNKNFYEFPGAIDDVRIYDRPLDGDDIWSLYQLADPGSNQPPNANFTVTQGIDDFTFDVDASSSTDDGTISQYFWDFGDGLTGDGITTSHTYLVAGTFEITLTVTDDGGLSDTATQTISIGTNQPPTASFTYSTNALTVEFTDQSSDIDGSITSWFWNFGDGSSSTSQHPSYTYASAGTFDVTLTVTDDGDAEDTFSLPVTVTSDTGNGAFLEQGGQVVFEAEHFMDSIDRSDHSWTETTAFAGYSSDGAMIAEPDNGTTIKRSPEINSPELSFDVVFSTIGTYYIWVRAWAPNDQGASFYVGYDGSLAASRMYASVFGEWTWTNVDRRGNSMTTTVDGAGMHSIQLWMLNDGLTIDKVVLSTDPAFIPQNEGPPESPRE